MSHFFNVADILSAYPNCIGLIAGNEIINNRNTLRAAPVVRAVVRDLKRYLRLKHAVTGQRILPVGYSAADARGLERPTRDYLAAGEEAERLDFWSVSIRHKGHDSIARLRLIRKTTTRGLALRTFKSVDTKMTYISRHRVSYFTVADHLAGPTILGLQHPSLLVRIWHQRQPTPKLW